MQRIRFNEALNIYQSLKNIWQAETTPAPKTQKIGHILEIAENYKVIIFDGFGVLNVGNEPIKLMQKAVKNIQQKNILTLVLSNGASLSPKGYQNKWQKLGFDFSSDQVMTSRDALSEYLKTQSSQKPWAIAASVDADVKQLRIKSCDFLSSTLDQLQECAGVILLSALVWSSDYQQKLLQLLSIKKLPVIYANSDVCAPYENFFSVEPGFWAYDLWQKTGIEPIFMGKPFRAVFDLVFHRLKHKFNINSADKILMVGDTPYTDILGAREAGLETLLLTKWGFCQNLSLAQINQMPKAHYVDF